MAQFIAGLETHQISEHTQSIFFISIFIWQIEKKRHTHLLYTMNSILDTQKAFFSNNLDKYIYHEDIT